MVVRTVPFEPSAVPFELFCMTAVADLGSLMGWLVVMCGARGRGCRRAGVAQGGREAKSLLYPSSEV